MSLVVGHKSRLALTPRGVAIGALALVPALLIALVIVPPRSGPADITRAALRIGEVARSDTVVTSERLPVPLDRRTIEAQAPRYQPSPVAPSAPPAQPAAITVAAEPVIYTPPPPAVLAPQPQAVRRASAKQYVDPHAAYGQVGPGSISR